MRKDSTHIVQRFTMNGVKTLIVSVSVGAFWNTYLIAAESIVSPDKSMSLVTIPGNIDEPESKHIIRLKRGGKVIWSTAMKSKATECEWSPSSLFLIITVEHIDKPEQLFLLETKDKPHLFDLYLSDIDDAIASTLQEGSDATFGYRSGIYGQALGPDGCKFIYLFQESDAAAVAELVLKVAKAPPRLIISSITPAKDRADLDKLLKNGSAKLRNYEQTSN
jgi:hypothetical protein